MKNRLEEILKNIETETSQIKKFLKKTFMKYDRNNRRNDINNHYNEDPPSILEENNRSNLLHAYYRYIWNSNFSSPIEKNLHDGANVIDLGCGSGIWLKELSSEYSNSNFIGIDINEMFPIEKIPKNLKFIKHDILDGIPYEDNTFDFIHLRFMIKCFGPIEWKTLILPEIFRICKPGGWIEIMDLDTNLYNVGPKTENYSRKINSMLGPSKIDVDQLQDIMNIYQDLGITIMKEKINAWYPFKSQNSDKPFEMTSEILNSLYPIMSKVLNLNQENYAKLLEQILEEVAKNKTYGKTYRIITQKLTL
ncbi:hypothetical protein RclHR1_07040005 [Rhizophagus clarus]|uniref:S-adenosyl-L-methionine-dependent methyltransferase n=1 Tax=Rhizophagus clarus TaxID=94130 RepID=A0A2Z6SBV3_9GLOM|nr:hypothetical protein RclHR1_07040005 [Rhizophagus clarus]GES79619.1 S-adenosyl-L-methionine-dependent methyltransferase [Rhizophagus clarus]